MSLLSSSQQQFPAKLCSNVKGVEEKKQSHLQLHQIKEKYQGINLIKEVNICTLKTKKTLIKVIKDDTNNWKGILCPWSQIINVI